MLSDEKMYARMKKGWRGGLHDGTVCGQGSTIGNAINVINWLPRMVDKYNIVTVCDAGAGDMHWVRKVQWVVDYKPFDLIPRSQKVIKLDITTEQLPECDAILCRMVLNHLGKVRTQMALELFRQSADYLFATHFVDGGKKRQPAFARLDLTEWLGEPIEMVPDGHETNCRLALWRL